MPDECRPTRFEVFDKDNGQSSVFDATDTERWGPVNYGEDWDPLELEYRFGVEESLYRHRSGHWTLVKERTYQLEPGLDAESCGKEARRLAVKDAAAWFVRHDVPLPADLLERAAPTFFSPGVATAGIDADISVAQPAALDHAAISHGVAQVSGGKPWQGEENGAKGKRFRVALSFPGEHRKFLAEVADRLARDLGQERVFYDKRYEAELARPDLDTYLQKIYHDDSDLIAVFLCAEYEKKDWCGLEWRAIRDLIKKRNSSAIMPFRFDSTSVPALFSIDGYVEIGQRSPTDVALLILQRLEHNDQEADSRGGASIAGAG